jgi:uncharacterized repeat protein (TIGR01451 family)
MNRLTMYAQEGNEPKFLQERSGSRVKKSQAQKGVATLFLVLALGVCTFEAAAAEVGSVAASVTNPAPLSVHLKQLKVVQGERGEVKFSDASVVMPGDVIEYRAVYSNSGATSLPVMATVPIPDGMEYQKDSAHSNNKLTHTVALKDSKFSKEPLVKYLVTASGTTQSQPLPYASYRYVRWDLGTLSPGKSVEVSVRAKVAQNLEVDASTEGKVSTLTSSQRSNQ